MKKKKSKINVFEIVYEAIKNFHPVIVLFLLINILQKNGSSFIKVALNIILILSMIGAIIKGLRDNK